MKASLTGLQRKGNTAQLFKDSKQDTSGWTCREEALCSLLMEASKVFTKRCVKWMKRDTGSGYRMYVAVHTLSGGQSQSNLLQG